MDKQEIEKLKKKYVSKKGISFLSQVAIIILIFGLYILGDYLAFGGTMEFATSPVYWITTSISLSLIIALMITVRQMQKEKQIDLNKNINNNMRTVQAVRKVVLVNAYDEQMQEYIDKVNEDYKYETFINKVTKKINRLNILPLTRKRKEKLLKKYEEQLRTPKEEVLKMNIRFHKITQTGLFAGVDGKLAVMSKFDVRTHEGKDVLTMTTSKALFVILLTVFSGTMVVSFFFGGWSAIWGTLIKIFSLLFATNQAINQANNFVAYNIEQALDNRLRIILGFVNSSEEVKSKVLEKLAEEKAEEEKSED